MGKDLKGNPLPPGIMQRKSGIYRGRFYYKGETYTKDNADLKKLVQEMEDLRYEVKHGLKGKGDNITLDTWFDIWLNTHKKRTIKESTQVRYDDFYRRYIKKQIGKQRVADFNPIILERLLQNMADDDYSTKTIRDVYNILNAMFKYAVHNRILTFNPCAGVEVPKTKTKQIRVLTVKEQREVLEHAKERIHENLIQVALGTGMRGGELLGLTWDVPQFHLPKTETANQLWNTKKSMRTNKTKPIPEDVFDKILYHAVHDEKDALTKAGIIIQSQTGLRINEVLSIQEGCVKRTSDGYDYMEVTLGKTEKGEPIIHKVFINGLVKNAIAELTEHTAELRKESGLKELFLCRIKSQNRAISKASPLDDVVAVKKDKIQLKDDKIASLREQVKKLEYDKKKLIVQLVDYEELKSENERLKKQLAKK